MVATFFVTLLTLDDDGPPVLQLLMPAVIAASYLGGWKPGLVTTVLATFGGVVLVAPRGDLAVHHPHDLLRVAVFAMLGVLISVLTEALHRSRRRAEESSVALRESDRRFMQTFSASPIPQSVTSLETRKVVDVNDAYCRVFGITRDQIIGRGPREAGLVIPQERAAELFAVLAETREIRDAVVECSSPAGKHTVLLSCHMIELSDMTLMLASHVDITARVAAEAKAHAASEQLHQLATAINEVFWLTDPDKKGMLYISPAYETIWGRSCAEIYAKPATWIDSIHPEDRERVVAALGKQASGTYDEQYRIVTPSGESRWIHDKAYPVRDESGAVIRIAGVATDITEQRRLEDQVRQAQKLESIGQLAGGIAHDFNNLLNVIVGNTDLLREDLAEPLHREMLDEVDNAVSRASALTRQLLAFSRKQPSKAVVIDVNRLVQDTHRMLRRLVGDDISIECSLDPELGPVRCDPSQLVQVLMNLAVNARDAMNGGGHLRIETRNEGNQIALVVSDSGCGMPPEIIARVFEPFFTTKEVGRGTGLGLAVVHGIIEQAGGTIRVDSVVGVGTRFTARLPRVADAVEACVNIAITAERGTERILLVDDDWHVRSATARGLRSRGYTVYEADGGANALRVLDDREVDLLVTDVVMPNMDGRRLFETAHRRKPDLPVLFISGYTDDEVVRRGVQASELSFLEKPFRVNALAAKVRQVLDEGAKPARQTG